MKHFTFHLLCIIILIGYQATKNCAYGQYDSTKQAAAGKIFSQIKVIPDYNTPTVQIDSLILITDDSAAHVNDAKAILRAKVIIPLAMQKHDASLFDSLLAKGFTARGEDEFFERDEFIRTRVEGKWMISYVQYENMVLQFFGEIAILTYRNTVKEKDATGMPKIWHFTWADVWVKEDGKWKIKAGYGIHGKEPNTKE